MPGAEYALAGKRVYVAGHRGMVGSALLRRLAIEGCDVQIASRAEADLRNQAAVEQWFAANRPQAVFLAAAKVGGIHANNVYRADFIYDNLMIAANVIHAAHRFGVEKLLFLASSCIYPKHAKQPMDEGQLLQGILEPTNEPYAIAKIAGLKMAESYRRQYGSDFISVMPTNLYGPGDNYDLANSHVLPAMLRKFHEAKLAGHAPVQLWGTGTAKREFLHVDDLADACCFLMEQVAAGSVPMDLYNVGSGQEVTVKELALMVQQIVGHSGEIRWDASKPDGTPRKLLDVSRLSARGWRSKVALREGLMRTYADYRIELQRDR